VNRVVKEREKVKVVKAMEKRRKKAMTLLSMKLATMMMLLYKR